MLGRLPAGLSVAVAMQQPDRWRVVRCGWTAGQQVDHVLTGRGPAQEANGGPIRGAHGEGLPSPALVEEVESIDLFSQMACLTMVFKLAESAERHWRRLNGSQLLHDVIRGVKFVDGIKQDTEEIAA
jgi:hypothetical protein